MFHPWLMATTEIVDVSERDLTIAVGFFCLRRFRKTHERPPGITCESIKRKEKEVTWLRALLRERVSLTRTPAYCMTPVAIEFPFAC